MRVAVDGVVEALGLGRPHGGVGVEEAVVVGVEARAGVVELATGLP